MFDPYLCGDEQLLAGNARLFESIAHFLFVEVRLCRVDVAVTGFQGIRNAAFALLLRYLIYAVSELGIFTPFARVTYSIKEILLLIYGYIIPPGFPKGNRKKVYRMNLK